MTRRVGGKSIKDRVTSFAHSIARIQVKGLNMNTMSPRDKATTPENSSFFLKKK